MAETATSAAWGVTRLGAAWVRMHDRNERSIGVG